MIQENVEAQQEICKYRSREGKGIMNRVGEKNKNLG